MMSDVIFDGSADPAPTPSPAVDARMQVAAEWKEASRPEKQDQSELTPREAARLIGKQRRDRGEEDADPILERRYDGGKDSLSLREAASDLKFTHQLEHAIGLHHATGGHVSPEHAGAITAAETMTKTELIEAGYSPEDASAILRARNEAPKMGLMDDKGNRLERMDDDHRVRPEDELSPIKAAHLLANFRRNAEAEHQQLLANLVSVNEQGQQAEQQAAPAQEELVWQQPAQPDPVAEEHSRIAKAREAHEHLTRVTAAEVQLANQIATAKQHALAQLSDLRSMDDLARLQQSNPQRLAAILAADQQVRAAEQQLNLLGENRRAREGQLAQHQQAEQTAAREAWAREQDAEFDREIAKSLPQFADAKTKGELKQAAVGALKSVGLTDQHINDIYHRGVPVDMRSAAAQTILAKAAAWDYAQARAREATRAPAPHVQRPGVARAPGSVNYDRLNDLTRAVDRAKGGSNEQLRAAAKLIGARRAAGTI